VEEQAKGPILNPNEMGLAHAGVAVENIASIGEYVELFKNAFPNEENPVSYDNIARAIGDFERTLTTPGRFDNYLSGDSAALKANEKKGLAVFIETGCSSCHKGALFGGGQFDKFGVFRPYQELTGSKALDTGRFEQTNKEDDRFVFKVAQLRNIERTYPYFHDGSVWKLDDAIRVMGEAQLGKKLAPDEVDAIWSFLKTLTGEVPVEARTLPMLPPASDTTCAPTPAERSYERRSSASHHQSCPGDPCAAGAGHPGARRGAQERRVQQGRTRSPRRGRARHGADLPHGRARRGCGGSLTDISADAIERHDEAATGAFVAVGLAGLAALANLVLGRQGRTPRWLTATTLVLALIASAWLGVTANLGGQIRHTEIHAAPTGPLDSMTLRIRQ